QAQRADRDELAKMRADLAAEKNRATPKAMSSAVGATDAKPALTLATGLKPAASFTNAGRATAREALETLQWAWLGGDTDVIAQGLILLPEARQKAEELFARLPDAKRTEFGTPEQMLANLLASTTPIAGMQVMSERPGAPHSQGFDPALDKNPNYAT